MVDKLLPLGDREEALECFLRGLERSHCQAAVMGAT